MLPSLWEGLGIAAIEAQTSGLPTLVSTNFPTDVKVTNQLYFLPLQIQIWIKKINEIEENSKKRPNNSEIIKKAGYDMQDTVNEIKTLYFNEKLK